jgi:predicted transposase YbfD/YdcC
MKSETLKHFEDMEDPRVVGRTIHPLRNIVFITIVGALCGLTGWEEIADFAKYRKGFFSKYIDVSMGLPCEDTLRRFFSALKPGEFRKRFTAWVTATVGGVAGKTVSLDGKTVRGASAMNHESPVHIVSAWVGENLMTLAQARVATKRNEISALNELLEILDLKGAAVTIDAMGCQVKIAERIVGHGADYVLALKKNQSTLRLDTEHSFEKLPCCADVTTEETDHGRAEVRRYRFIDDLSHLFTGHRWKGLKMIVRVDSEVTDKKTGETTRATRYYITSMKRNQAERCAECIRSHWGVESMHWSLDVTFGEDSDTKREGNSAENFNIIRKMALNVLKNDGVDYGKKRVSLKRRMFKAALDDEYRKQLISLL